MHRAHRALARARVAGPHAVVALMLTGTAHERLMARFLSRAERQLLAAELRQRDRALRASAPLRATRTRRPDAHADLQALALALLKDAGLAARWTSAEVTAALRADLSETGPVARALDAAVALRASHVLASIARYRRSS